MPVHKIAIIQLEPKVIHSQVSCHRRASNTRDKKRNPSILDIEVEQLTHLSKAK